MPVPISFSDYRKAQSPVTVSGANMIKAAAQKARYGWVYAARAKGGMLHKYGGGDILQEKVALGDSTTFASYVPDDVAATSAQQVMALPTTYTVYGRDYIRWTKQEAVHNGQSGDFSEAARSIKYFNFNTSLDVRQQTSTANGMETKWAAVPNAATMDFLGCTEPNSIFHLVNEFPNSLYVSVAGGAFTTKHGISPATYPSFRNHIFGYNSALNTPATAGDKNLINALDTANERMPYSPPTGMGFDRSPENWLSEGWGSKVGLTSFTGVEIAKDLLRQRNQTWTMTNEMGLARPVYNGMELVSLPSLQSAAVYPSTADGTEALGYTTNTTPVTEGASTAYGRGPRIYILDTGAYGMYINQEGNFTRGDVIEYENQPGTYAQFVDVWYQYFLPMPWLCGVISPGTVAGTFPSITYDASTVYAAY